MRDFAGVFAAMIAGFGIFGLGWGAHIAHLAESNRECIPKGSYVLKTDLVGCILGKEAAAKIAVFIEQGKHLGNNDAETRIWLDQVLTFVQTIKLPDDTVDENGKPMSKVELNIKNAFRELKVKVQAQKTLGILTGFQAALETQALNQ